MARALARDLRAPLVTSTVSRLVIDLNRSIGHPQLFSAATRGVPAAVREEIVATVRRFVEREVLPTASELEHANEYPHALVARLKERMPQLR